MFWDGVLFLGADASRIISIRQTSGLLISERSKTACKDVAGKRGTSFS